MVGPGVLTGMGQAERPEPQVGRGVGDAAQAVLDGVDRLVHEDLGEVQVLRGKRGHGTSARWGGHDHPHPTASACRAGDPHLGVGAVPPALHVLLGGVDGAAGLLPLQQRLLLLRGHRLHGDDTDGETPPRSPGQAPPTVTPALPQGGPSLVHAAGSTGRAASPGAGLAPTPAPAPPAQSAPAPAAQEHRFGVPSSTGYPS